MSRWAKGLVVLATFATAGCARTSTPTAQIDSMTMTWGVGNVEANVREDGLFCKAKLSVFGAQGREVPVQVFDAGGRFLGQELAMPPYEGTEWAEFSIFLPVSRLGKLGKGTSLTAYVLNPGDPSEYIGTASRAFDLTPQDQVWELLSLEQEVALANGETGVRFKAKLDLSGQKGRTLPLTLVCMTLAGEEMKDPFGEWLRVPQFDLEPIYDDTIWPSLVLEVPYSRFAHLPAGTSVEICPSIRMSDGFVHRGNLHVTLYTGGSLETIAARLQEQERALSEKVTTLEKELEALQPGGGK